MENSMKHILIAAPTEREYRYIKSAVERAGSTRNDYTVICCGVGKAAAAASVAAALASSGTPFDMVAVIGFAAGSAGLHQGDIVAPSAARYHDCNVPDGFVPELTDPYALAGGDGTTVFTGDSFVDKPIVEAVKERFGATRAIFDMEITAIAIAASLCGDVPVAAVKFISDVPEDGHTDLSYEEFADSHSDFAPLLKIIETL